MNKNLTLFKNATIYIDADTKVKNLLVENGKVKAYDVDEKDYKGAKVIDLKGKFVYPGFCDSHVHLVEVGSILGAANLFGSVTSDQIAKKMAPVAKKTPKGKLVVGNGFYPKDYTAWSLEDLAKIDKATKGHPAVMFDQLGHNCIVNSEGMKKCGITTKTPVPIGGRMIIKDNKPSGMFMETGMLLVGNKLLKFLDPKIAKKGIKQLFDLWASTGYTAIVDLMGAPFGRIMNPEICMELEKEGKLPLRVNYRYTFFNLDEIDDALKYKSKSKNTDQVRFVGLKLFVDGAYSAGDAWTARKNLQGNNGLHCVYINDKYGKIFNIYRIVEKANNLGLNVHYHVQGDKAIGIVLDAIEKAKKKKGKLTSVHTLIHLAFPTDAQLKQIKRLSPHVNTTTQPGFWAVESASTRYYGDKAKGCYPAKKMMDMGISTGLSTDFSVSPLKLAPATEVMSIALTGAGDPKNHPPLTMRDIIKGFGEGSANTTGIDDAGKLEPGRWADFVVYDQDLYNVPAKKFTAKNPKVLATWVGGKQAYKA